MATGVIKNENLYTPSGKNLLTNWDWRSKIINRPGLTTYSNDTTSMNKAFNNCRFSCSTISIANGVVTWTSLQTAEYKRIQLKADTQLYMGTTYTLTLFAKVREKSGTVYLRPCDNVSMISSSPSNPYAELEVTSAYVPYVITFTPTASVSTPYVEILCHKSESDYVTVDIAAWKLETGSKQTLVAIYGSGWALRDQTITAEELIKCQADEIAAEQSITYRGWQVMFFARTNTDGFIIQIPCSNLAKGSAYTCSSFNYGYYAINGTSKGGLSTGTISSSNISREKDFLLIKLSIPDGIGTWSYGAIFTTSEFTIAAT